MPRKPRLVIPSAPHHCTQRGVCRQPVFFSNEDRVAYLDMLQFYTRKLEVPLLAYCLMTNHVHHILVPQQESDLRSILQPIHMRFAQNINAERQWTGHLWQARFYSAPIYDEYFWLALKYVERNPVRAGMVEHAADYQWSSAAAHCGLREDKTLYYPDYWRNELSRIKEWYDWLAEDEHPGKIALLRRQTKADRPCALPDTLERLETEFQVDLSQRPVGRPRK